MSLEQMENTENLDHVVNRQSWPKGEWDTEPEDRVEWRHDGHPCLIVRNHTGAWCGYVGVPPWHPAHGKSYDDVSVEVHGGLTYASKCRGAICHVPLAGEPDAVYWLGFDTAHLGDLVPGMPQYQREAASLFRDDVYRNKAYVMREVESLCDQLFDEAKISELIST